jgi:phosphomannomutase
MARLEEVFTSEQAESDRLDGLTITSDDWWFNVRPSNTEPLLRLNVEGVTPDLMTRTRDRVLSLMTSRA